MDPIVRAQFQIWPFLRNSPTHSGYASSESSSRCTCRKVNHFSEDLKLNLKLPMFNPTLKAQRSNQIYAFSSSICSVGVGISVGTWDVRWRVKRELEPPQERQKNVVTAKIRKKKRSTNKGPATKKEKSPSKSSWIGGMLVGLTVIAPKIHTPTFPDCLCIGLIRLDLPNQVEVQCC